MFVARMSQKIEEDINRGWSAWMSQWEAEPADLLFNAGEFDAYDSCEDLDNDAVVEIAEKAGYDIRLDKATGLWASVHHDGLSCFELSAQSLEDAIAELETQFVGKSVNFANGDVTVGAVTLVHTIGDWHILECASTYPES